jgi:hypothetical protein
MKLPLSLPAKAGSAVVTSPDAQTAAAQNNFNLVIVIGSHPAADTTRRRKSLSDHALRRLAADSANWPSNLLQIRGVGFRSCPLRRCHEGLDRDQTRGGNGTGGN